MKRSEVFWRKYALPKYRQQTLIIVSSFESKRIVAIANETHTMRLGEYFPSKGVRNA